jgi:hypothetical protein
LALQSLSSSSEGQQRQQQQQQQQHAAAGYAGHYLLLTGYDAAARLFWVQDPAKPSGPCRLAADTLEAGRRAFGTDEDLLIIDLPPARSWGDAP